MHGPPCNYGHFLVKAGPVRKEASRIFLVQWSHFLLSKFRAVEPVVCWERDELVFGVKRIFEGVVLGLLPECGEMGKMSPVEQMQRLLIQAHTALVSYHLPYSHLLLSLFSCSFFALFDLCCFPFGFCCCPYSLKFFEGSFPFIFTMCWYSVVLLTVFQAELKKCQEKEKWNWLIRTV